MRRLLTFGVIVGAMLLCVGCPQTVVVTPPPPPPHSAAMHWDAVGDASYTVYRGSSADTLAPLDTTTAPQYTDKQVQAGTTYFYAVKGKDDIGNESQPSNVVNATIPAN